MPKVSVIVPNYNHATYLHQRIVSILNQSYQDFELIFLDDFSSDNSQEIILEYKGHPKVAEIIFNKQNSGSPFNQWKKGLDSAKGDYIWIAESDDWAESQFLEKLMPVIESDQNIGLVHCDSNVFEMNEKKRTLSEIKNMFSKTDKWAHDYIANGVEELKHLAHFCTVTNASAAIFRKEIARKIFPLKYDFRFMGDWYMYIYIAASYKIAYLSQPLNNYRVHDSNASRKVNEELSYVKERFFICDFIISQCPFLDRKEQIKSFLDYSVHKVNLKHRTLSLYKELKAINPDLLWTLIRYNIISSWKNRIKKLK